ncbi:MAG: DNA polymerase III subunit gamma/tau [Gemmatales bacterium]|nr:DNA polymerase III subunit gamma/tau [Gemmatales bacterium]MDW7994035.1 DNA polymerase III subunit gamma/tau [Gemmatales bacterium]
MAKRTRVASPTPLSENVPKQDSTPASSAGYTVLARRYRPQQFADLIGQDALVQALTNALKSNRVAHAYLFTGARGVGKTSTARILAKCLNCVHGPTVTPCDQCESCKAIAVGEDVDVIEIDGASNNRVEEIRELRSNAQYRPTRSRFKIYIIDEVHMLTTSAFNALLKTLEEPPPHVKFIFATTEVHKVPLTILSRCQRFDFAHIRTEDILQVLKKIVAQEGVSAEEQALRLIARRAAGSLRDAESLLDQALAFGGGRLTLAQAEELLGLAGEEQILALAEAILDRDAARAWTLLDEALRRGVSPSELCDQLLDYWRDLLLLQTVGPSCESFTFADRHLSRLKPRALALPVEQILTAMDLIAGTKGRLRGSSQPRVLLEILLVRLTRLESFFALSEMLERLVNPEATSACQGEAGSRVRSPATEHHRAEGVERPFVGNRPEASGQRWATGQLAHAGSASNSSDKTAAAGVAELTQELPADSEKSANPISAQPSPTPIQFTEAQLPRLREALLTALGTSTLRFDLERAHLAISAPNRLALRFAPCYNAEKSRCERRRADLEALVRRILQRDIQLRFETDFGAGVPQPEADTARRTRNRLQALEQIPLIREAVQKLGARFIPERLEPDFGQAELSELAQLNPEHSR